MNRFSDAQIFFASVLGLAGTFCAFRPLRMLVAAGTELTNGPTMVALLTPEATLRSLYVLFIILPVSLAFLAIGLPLFVIFFVRSMRRGWYREELVAMAAFSVSLAVTVLGRSVLWVFQTGLIAVMLTAAIACWPILSEYGYRSGRRILGLAGLFLAGAVYYQWSYMGTGEVSVAVAPTFIVVAGFLMIIGIALIVTTARSTFARVPAVMGVPVLAVGAWVGAQFVRVVVESRAAGDVVELRTTLVVALVLVVWALASGPRARVKPTIS